MLKTVCLAAAFAAVAITPALAQSQGGFYAGADVGYGKPKNELTYTPATGPALKGSSDKTGFNYGGFVGYGTVLDGGLYLGAEAALSAGGGESTRTFGATKVHLDPRLRYSGAARAGMAIGDSGLLYGKVGLERRKLEVSVPASKKTLTQQGVVFGVGYEQKLSDTFGLRGELTRVSYGDKTAAFKAGDRVKVDSKETRLSIGGVVHF
jgi:hypothetical protein